jgi:hypothetical protein
MFRRRVRGRVERRDLEGAEGPVPDQRLRPVNRGPMRARSRARRRGSSRPAGRRWPRRWCSPHPPRRPRATTTSSAARSRSPPLPALARISRAVSPGRARRASPHLVALGGEEGVRHAAADHQHVDLPIRFSRRSSLVETLAPPTTATTGRSGSPSAVSSARSSASISRPAQAGRRCASPRSRHAPGAPPRRRRCSRRRRARVGAGERSGSFFSSPGWKRVFSSSSTAPGASAATAARSPTQSSAKATSCPSAARARAPPARATSPAPACPSAARNEPAAPACRPRPGCRHRRHDPLDPRRVRHAARPRPGR